MEERVNESCIEPSGILPSFPVDQTFPPASFPCVLWLQILLQTFVDTSGYIFEEVIFILVYLLASTAASRARQEALVLGSAVYALAVHCMSVNTYFT